MKTKLDVDDDMLQAPKGIASNRGTKVGLEGASIRNGVPLMPRAARGKSSHHDGGRQPSSRRGVRSFVTMIEVTITEAKTHLSRLLAKVEAGEEVFITRHGQGIAKMIAIGKTSKNRVLGQFRGEIVIGDDFDDPVDPETWR
jgi:prevent-host-death family protein